jgi:hypothetical protein
MEHRPDRYPKAIEDLSTWAQIVPRPGVVPLAVVVREGGGTVRVMSIGDA